MATNNSRSVYQPFGGVPEVMKDLQATVFAGQEVHQLQMDAGGRIGQMIWPTGV